MAYIIFIVNMHNNKCTLEYSYLTYIHTFTYVCIVHMTKHHINNIIFFLKNCMTNAFFSFYFFSFLNNKNKPCRKK